MKNFIKYFGLLSLCAISSEATIFQSKSTVVDPNIGEDVVFNVYVNGFDNPIYSVNVSKNSQEIKAPTTLDFRVPDGFNDSTDNGANDIDIAIKVKAPNLIELPCKLNGNNLINVPKGNSPSWSVAISGALLPLKAVFTLDGTNFVYSFCTVTRFI